MRTKFMHVWDFADSFNSADERRPWSATKEYHVFRLSVASRKVDHHHDNISFIFLIERDKNQ